MRLDESGKWNETDRKRIESGTACLKMTEWLRMIVREQASVVSKVTRLALMWKSVFLSQSNIDSLLSKVFSVSRAKWAVIRR